MNENDNSKLREFLKRLKEDDENEGRIPAGGTMKVTDFLKGFRQGVSLSDLDETTATKH